jgi:hypothetical protein
MQAPDITAFELAASLDAYEEQLAVVRRAGSPLAVAQLQKSVHRVCRSCMGLPQLAVASVAFLLAHHGFLADLMREGGGAGAPSTQLAMQALDQCVRSLHRQCRELLVAPPLR